MKNACSLLNGDGSLLTIHIKVITVLHHRITTQLGMEGTSGDTQSNPILDWNCLCKNNECCVLLQNNFFFRTYFLQKNQNRVQKDQVRSSLPAQAIQKQSQKLISLPIFTLRLNHECQIGSGLLRPVCHMTSFLPITKNIRSSCSISLKFQK